MKGELTLKILEHLEEAAATAVDLTMAILSSGYGASFNKVYREFGRRHFGHSFQIRREKELVIQRRNFQNLLYKLKKEGLVVESEDNLFDLTRQGKKKIDLLRNRLRDNLPEVDYQKEKDGKFKIIIFDIPERERRKRTWLRSVLVNLDFTMLQKSVWLGKSKIPEDLMNDLEKLELLPFVEILEINKTGSLRSFSKR